MDNKLINPILTAALAFGLLALAPATYAAFSSMPMPPASTTTPATAAPATPASAATSTITTTTSTTTQVPAGMEKCYGIAKTGMFSQGMFREYRYGVSS